MSKKTMLLALAAVSAAMFALPAVASAEVWHQVPSAGGTTGPNFTVAGGTQRLENTKGFQIVCHNVAGSGSYDLNSTTTGKVNLAFHGCAQGSTETGLIRCTTGTDEAGTITTKNLTFHNILIHKETPGVLLTPENPDPVTGVGVFAHFVCFGVTIQVTGTGLIGHLNKKCNEESTEATLTFEELAGGGANTGVQKFQQITTAGKKFDLHTSLNEGATYAFNGSTTLNFAKSKLVCT